MYEYKATILRVVDGDTLDLLIDLGMNVHVKERVRLARINTPEIHGVKKDSEEYIKGMQAKLLVETILAGQELIVKTIKDKKGKYGRYIAEIYIDKDGNLINLSDHLVEYGHAEFKSY